MAFDSLSPVAPARVRCLLVPCGRITRTEFVRFQTTLEQASTVRLGDVSPNNEAHNNTFSPQAFPSGTVFYDMYTSDVPPSQMSLTPFELYRMPLVVLGIASGASLPSILAEDHETASLKDSNEAMGGGQLPVSVDLEDLTNELTWLQNQYASALVRQIFCFDCSSSSSSAPRDLVVIPERLKTTTMKTIMCDLTSLLLSQMAVFAQSVQARSSIETPSIQESGYDDSRGRPGSRSNDVSRPGSRLSDTPGSRTGSPMANGERSPYRASLPAHISSSLPQSPRSEVDSHPPSRESSRGPAMTFDEINGSKERPLSVANVEMMRHSSRDLHQAQPSAPVSMSERARSKARGRTGVVLGSMYLMAGRWPDAVRELTESAFLARSSNDHVWHAKALDYILVCLLLYGWAGMDFTIPSICSPLAEKEATSSRRSGKTASVDSPDLGALKSPPAVSRAVALQQLCSLLPDLINNILHLYVRAATFTVDKIPQLSFSESTVRFSKLLACIHVSHSSLSDQCLQTIVYDTVLEPQEDTASDVEHFPSKSEIAWTLFRALPGPGSERSMDLLSLLRVYAGIASILSLLGYGRKRAFVLREMISLLSPAVIQSRKDNAALLGIHPATSLSSVDLIQQSVESRQGVDGSSGSPQGLHIILNVMADLYGVTLPEDSGKRRAQQPLSTSGSAQDSMVLRSTFETLLQVVRNSLRQTFGSPRLKFDILRSCLQISEALPDTQGIVEYTSALLLTANRVVAAEPETGNLSPLMPIDDQTRMMTMMKRTAGASRISDGVNVEGTYWDDFLLRDIQVQAPKLSELPRIRRKADLKNTLGANSKVKGGPFIYNPFGAKSGTEDAVPTLILGERRAFTIRLQNLYDVDIEFEWIRLETTNLAIEAETKNILVGPSRIQSVHISGIPKLAGQHSILGCIAKVSGCAPKRFPFFKDSWQPKDETRIKRMGLAAASLQKTELSLEKDKSEAMLSVPGAPKTSALQINVIQDQPIISARFGPSYQSAIVLLDGETKPFTMLLHNPGPEVLDFIMVTIIDSISSSVQAALTDKELTPVQIHEAEHAAYSREALRVASSKEGPRKIPAKENWKLEVETYGKFGLTQGSINVEYGHVGESAAGTKDFFYTRLLTVPMSFTVNSSIQLIQTDFLPFSSQFAWLNKQQSQLASATSPNGGMSVAQTPLATQGFNRFQGLFRRLGLGSHGEDHCVLLLDFQNAWSKPLSISLQVRNNVLKDSKSEETWQRAYTVHETVQPSSTCRTLVLLPRISLKDPFRAIPSLNPANRRQFVVSASKVTPETERLNRELFWYKEEVLKYLRANWEEPQSGRHGDVSLRSLQLTPKMLEAIKLEDIAIDLSLRSTASEAQNGNVTSQSGRAVFGATTDAHLVLLTRITNRRAHPIRPLLRLQPSLRHQPYNIALDLAKKIAFNGLLQRSLPALGAGESKEIPLGLIFLCAGEYEIDASIEEIRPWRAPTIEGVQDGKRQRANTGDFDLSELESTERKVWYARDRCTINVASLEDAFG